MRKRHELNGCHAAASASRIWRDGGMAGWRGAHRVPWHRDTGRGVARWLRAGARQRWGATGRVRCAAAITTKGQVQYRRVGPAGRLALLRASHVLKARTGGLSADQTAQTIHRRAGCFDRLVLEDFPACTTRGERMTRLRMYIVLDKFQALFLLPWLAGCSFKNVLVPRR